MFWYGYQPTPQSEACHVEISLQILFYCATSFIVTVHSEFQVKNQYP